MDNKERALNMSEKTIALSLFSGIGGFEVGMAKCGFSFAKTLEWDHELIQKIFFVIHQIPTCQMR